MISAQFKVIHSKKKDQTSPSWSVPEGWLSLETCQRYLAIGMGDADSGTDAPSGSEAYSFLLEVATGLQSAVPGETEVFGQLKEAWARYLADHGPQAAQLSPIFQSLFADTKEIRSRFLQGVGGSSYGTLARRWLNPRQEDRVLILGAGALAQAVVPIFLDYRVTVLNRSSNTITTLRKKLEKQSFSKALKVEWLTHLPTERPDPWKDSDYIILCRPTIQEDKEKIDAILKRSSLPRVLHLGIRREDQDPWKKIPGLGTLDDLFELQKTQASVRDLRFAQARRACRDKALLRALGGPANLAHGWEDLAVFAE